MPARQTKSLAKDFTVGSIPKQLISFALPFMASNAFQVMYSLADMVIVGQYVSSFGLSAVSIASQVTMFCTALCIGFSTGGQVLIAQLLGAKRKDQLNRCIGTLFTTVLMLGAACSLLLLCLRRPIMDLIHVPMEARAMVDEYLAICGGGIIFTFGYNTVSAILRGMGDSKHPFLFIMIASLINVALDLLFIAGFHWGVAGAALATVIGQAASFLFAVRYLHRRREAFGFDFRPASFQIAPAILKKLSYLGVPFAIQSCAINLSMIFVNSLVSGVGVYASAAFGVGVKLDDIVTKLTQGIMYAVSPMVGQNIAAGQVKRTKKIVYWALGITSVLYFAFTLVYIPCCKQMFGLFTDDLEVITLAPTFVSAILWCFPALAVMRSMGGFVQGMGNASLMLVLGLLDGLVFRVVLSYTFGILMGMGLYGFILGYGLASYAFAVPASVYFFSGIWERRKALIEAAA